MSFELTSDGETSGGSAVITNTETKKEATLSAVAKGNEFLKLGVAAMDSDEVTLDNMDCMGFLRVKDSETMDWIYKMDLAATSRNDNFQLYVTDSNDGEQQANAMNAKAWKRDNDVGMEFALEGSTDDAYATVGVSLKSENSAELDLEEKNPDTMEMLGAINATASMKGDVRVANMSVRDAEELLAEIQLQASVADEGLTVSGSMKNDDKQIAAGSVELKTGEDDMGFNLEFTQDAQTLRSTLSLTNDGRAVSFEEMSLRQTGELLDSGEMQMQWVVTGSNRNDVMAMTGNLSDKEETLGSMAVRISNTESLKEATFSGSQGDTEIGRLEFSAQSGGGEVTLEDVDFKIDAQMHDADSGDLLVMASLQGSNKNSKLDLKGSVSDSDGQMGGGTSS
eukprot:CAMPEP_0117608566 /NCGR_PEP_ID=MMETSP0784-20121206/80874_1 /TAXON_ID=39447 /ORGANISM="" /LENGTH=394 /DNA_ID=CAMNT_0005411843 /DNA_START=14 /DNA_END=1195 /DNA_ORIENTATION=+